MRKIAANYVFPVAGEPIRNGYVKFNDNNEVVEIGQLDGECADTEFYSGILCPGFTNAHNHVELSHLLGAFNQATGMSGFINQINALRDTVDQEGRIKALEYQMEKMYAEGVQAMADISNCSESFPCKAKSPMYTRTFLELFGSEPKDAQDVLESGKRLAQKSQEFGIDAAITPHSCYTMSPQLLAMAAQEGLKSGYLSYHSQESDEEEELIISGTGALADNYKGRGLSTPPVTGKPALVYFIDRLLGFSESPVKGNILLVHNVAINQESIDYAKKHLATPYFAICPLSNIFIHRALPPLDLMRENGLKICLGTDSLSSNTVLSIAKEIVCLHNNFPHIELEEILQWACLNGAQMLGKDDKLGTFEVGKQPGAVLIENVDWDNFKLTENSTTRRII
ncbi:MAG: amidohydrolase family protein [Bacteroidales bacterium]|nr:amidohydrolase family protein [Bacteroidales bacterium]MBO7269250.1 amidohydrolase family protein [Bacteroidales bacterium]